MKTITFFYSYGMGGWGDLVKGLHTAWCWSNALNRNLRIHFHNHVFLTIFPQHSHPIMRLDLNTIDQVGKVTVADLKQFESQDNITITCNWFSTQSIGTVDPNPFYQELYTTWFPIRLSVQIPSGFHVLHCRLGDKYLTEATSCKGDNRIGSIARLKQIVEDYNRLGHEHTLVCGDSAPIIKELLKTVNGAFAICQTPYHIAYNSPTILDHTADIKLMIQEHQAMTMATSITMVAYSGFPITAGRIGTVPLFLYTDATRNPYEDSY